VSVIHFAFFGGVFLFLFKPEKLECLFKKFDMWARYLLDISFANLLMLNYQVFGWVLISAIVAGIGNTVFGHMRR